MAELGSCALPMFARRDPCKRYNECSYFPLDGGLLPLPPPEGLPVRLGQFGFGGDGCWAAMRWMNISHLLWSR